MFTRTSSHYAAGKSHRAANDNDPTKGEYLRLAEAQDKISGLVLVTLKTGIKLSANGRFFVVSRAFRADAKITRKTVYNHFRKLVDQGFLVQLPERRGTFPAYRLTAIDAWQQMLPTGATDISQGCETLSHQLGKASPPYTLRNSYDPKASQDRSAALVKSEKERKPSRIPAWLRDAFLAEFDDGKAISYLDPSTFDGSSLRLDVPTSPARDFSIVTVFALCAASGSPSPTVVSRNDPSSPH